MASDVLLTRGLRSWLRRLETAAQREQPLGAYSAPNKDERVYLGLTCAVPMIGFLFFGSDAREITTQEEMNYWGKITVPVLVALSPLGLGALADKAEAWPNRRSVGG